MSSNLTGLYQKGVSYFTSPYYLWRSFGPFSLPRAQKWSWNSNICTYLEILMQIITSWWIMIYSVSLSFDVFDCVTAYAMIIISVIFAIDRGYTAVCWTSLSLEVVRGRRRRRILVVMALRIKPRSSRWKPVRSGWMTCCPDLSGIVTRSCRRSSKRNIKDRRWHQERKWWQI